MEIMKDSKVVTRKGRGRDSIQQKLSPRRPEQRALVNYQIFVQVGFHLQIEFGLRET